MRLASACGTGVLACVALPKTAVAPVTFSSLMTSCSQLTERIYLEQFKIIHARFLEEPLPRFLRFRAYFILKSGDP